MTQLPDFKIIRHARAKKMRVRVYSQRIEVCVPKYCPEGLIHRFIQDSMVWITQTWQQKSQDSLLDELPQHLHVFDRDQALILKIIAQKKAFIWCEESGTVHLDQDEPRSALAQFLLAYAKRYLLSYLQEVSADININYTHSQTRFAKSRWGSCNTQQKIMLNAILVLLPLPVVRYVCVHELVHVQHFNHSAQFWSKVESLDLNYLVHEQQLKAFQWPHWLLSHLKYI